MTYTAQKPRYTLNFDGVDYELVGSFQMLEAIEHAAQMDVIEALVKLIDGMTLSTVSKLLAAMLNQSGLPIKAPEVGEIITNKIGVGTDEYAMLKVHMATFIRIAVTKPADREKVADDMGKQIGGLETASRGEGSSNSALEPSTGHPKRSGRRTSGK